MIGKTIAHYKILEKIGEGGMGVVYKAEDTKLKRTVALKFLPPELTRDPQAKARFVQEAQAAAALDHPNICAVFEIGEAEGSTYIAMPYVKGRSLKERIALGPIPIEEALAIAGQVAEGLKEAHEKGIIHRDIKPANIMLTEKGQAKIMDFGLAKLESGIELTRTMAVMGTAAYMSPEQARGEAVDQRTDIWSFGATLYEVLTGQKPFGQKHDQALIYSILNDTTDTASRIRPEIPNYLDRIIQKTLEKDKSRRYPNMAELLKDLKSTQVIKQSLPKSDKSIIVLPFENISSDPEQDYFCDGMTEEIITDLSHVHDLLVISRSSAMTFKGTKKKIPEIAREVNVRYVLEGSVRKAGNNLRITAQLIDALNDAHLWAEKYDGTLDDVFDIQEKVSRSIGKALKLKLTPEESARIFARPIANPEIYDLHIMARHETWQATEHGLDRASRLVKKGLDLIGDNEILYADLGFINLMYFDTGIRKDESVLLEAEKCIQEVFSLDPESAYGHYLRGMIERKRRNPQQAVKEFKKSLAIDPNHPDPLMWLGWVYAHSGRISEARRLTARIVKIDPLNLLTYFGSGAVEVFDGKFRDGIKEFDKALQMDERNPFIKFWLARTLSYAQLLRESHAQSVLIEKEAQGTVWAGLASFHRHALEGKKSEALQTAAGDFRDLVKDDESFPIWMAESYALIGEAGEAVEWLENAVNWGFINYPFLVEYDPFLANIRSEPRFQKLMERVKYEWEHFEV